MIQICVSNPKLKSFIIVIIDPHFMADLCGLCSPPCQLDKQFRERSFLPPLWRVCRVADDFPKSCKGLAWAGLDPESRTRPGGAVAQEGAELKAGDFAGRKTAEIKAGLAGERVPGDGFGERGLGLEVQVLDEPFGGEGLGVLGLEILDARTHRLDREKSPRGSAGASTGIACLNGSGPGVWDKGESLGEGFMAGVPQGIGRVLLGRGSAS